MPSPPPTSAVVPAASSREVLIDLWRQWPWIWPRGVERSAVEWIRRAQERAGWYAGLRGNWHEPLHPGGVLTSPPPSNLPEVARRQFHEVATRRYPDAGVFHFSGASLVGDAGLIVSPDNRVFAEFHHQFTRRPQALGSRPFGLLNLAPRRFAPPVALLAAPEARNHYHWLFDVLPRVHLLQRWREVIEWYAVPAGLNAVQLESLRLLGITPDRLLPLAPATRLRCQHLYVPSLPGSEGSYPPWTREFLQAAFLPQATAISGAGPRIYVRRGASAPRPVLNEPAVIARLEARGFRAVALEQHTLLEQVAIFRDAQMVVAAHGAGLANLAFSRRAALLELFSREYLRPDCYFTLVRQAGLPYDCWVDERTAGPGRPWGAITVDLDVLERKLDELDRK